MILKVNQENIEVMCHFGLNFLFDGYLTSHTFNQLKTFIINDLLFDAYLTSN